MSRGFADDKAARIVFAVVSGRCALGAEHRDVEAGQVTIAKRSYRCVLRNALHSQSRQDTGQRVSRHTEILQKSCVTFDHDASGGLIYLNQVF